MCAAMNSEWREKQGVPSIANQWINMRYPDGPAKGRPGKPWLMGAARCNGLTGTVQKIPVEPQFPQPKANPHAGWCGGSGFNPRSYRILLFGFFLARFRAGNHWGEYIAALPAMADSSSHIPSKSELGGKFCALRVGEAQSCKERHQRYVR
jgi:hypothetical protein